MAEMRAKGGGHKRDDGRWVTRVTLRDGKGDKYGQDVYGGSQAEMLKNARELILKTGGKLPTPATIEDLVTLCENTRWPSLAEKTQEQYGWAKVRILDHLKDVKVTAFRPTNAAKFLRTISEDPEIGGRSVQIHRNLLSGMFRVAVEEGWRDDNPMRDIVTPVSAKPDTGRDITEGEWRAVLAKEKNPVLRDLWHILGSAGLRPFKEALPLERSQLSYAHDLWWINVRDSKTEAGKGRSLPLPDDLGARLYDRPDGFLWLTGNGTLWERRNINRAWAAALVRANVEHCRLYSLRSLAITRWEHADLSPDVRKALAGHTKLSMTMHYVRMGKERLAGSVWGLSVGSQSNRLLGIGDDGPELPPLNL